MSEPRLAVLGAGTMGSGIAQTAALGGYRTLLFDVVPEAAETGAERARAGLAKGAERGRWSEAEARAAAARLAPVTDLAALAGCALAIEAAPEDLALKRDLLTAVAVACGPETVLATNTSSLRVSDIAAGVPGPERLVGMHFFNPPALMKLVEVVAAERSSEAALATATEAAERMGRTPIRARDLPGFVANRLARPFYLESLRILADRVADAPTIDRAVRGAGFRMGPFELIDLIGLDVNLEIARSFFVQGGEPERWRPSPVQEQLVAAGRLGRKSGEGYYRYPRPEGAEEDGPAPPQEVLDRLFAQIANETAFALEAGVASPRDMETAVELGLNWPLGPLAIAARIGPGRAVAVLDELREEKGDAYLVAPRLRAEAEGEKR
jgi:3-hydroxybutyryl-CoA dehydrogenase